MHTSSFSYNLSRPYPYRWFTPVAVVGGIIATVLFSAVNLATNGYQLKTIYTTNPNGTLTQSYWFTNAPWAWSAKLRPTCEAQNLSPGTEYFTTNLGLSYRLERVSKTDPDTNAIQSYPALAYLNNTLENCQVENIIIYLKRADQSAPPDSAWWSWDDSSASALVNCTVQTGSGLVDASFSTSYKQGPRDYNYLIQTNTTRLSSLWWGTRLMNLYWNGLLTAMAVTIYNETDYTPRWDKGQITFQPNMTNDAKSLDLLGITYFFLPEDGKLQNYAFALPKLYNDLVYSATLMEGFGFAKAFYSLLLADLGQAKLPNFLLDPDLLQYLLAAPDDPNRSGEDAWLVPKEDCQQCPSYSELCPPNKTCPNDVGVVPANESYNAFKDTMGPLGTFNATMFSQYVCSIPQKKDTNTMLLSVVLADLVFLSALWSLFQLVTSWLLRRSDPNADACERCLGEAVPLADLDNRYPEASAPITNKGLTLTRPSSTSIFDGESTRSLLR